MADALADLTAYVEAHPELLKTAPGCYTFTIEDEVVSVNLTKKGTPPRVFAGKLKDPDKPDLEVKVSRSVYEAFRAGKLSSQTAFYDGRIVIKGTQPLFLKFWRLIG